MHTFFLTLLGLALLRASTCASSSPASITELEQLNDKLVAIVTEDEYPIAKVGEVVRITNPEEGFHMFGYFEKSPWSPDDSTMLVSRIPSYNTSLHIEQRADIGLIRLPRKGEPLDFKWEKVESTGAWNHQQGTMMQWLGVSNERILFNDRGCGDEEDKDSFCAVIYNLATNKRERTLPMPVYHVNRAGTVAVALNFGRLHVTRVGYGYAVTDDRRTAERRRKVPDDDGIFVMDLTQPEVKPRLLVSMRRVWSTIRKGRRADSVTGLPYINKKHTADWYERASKCLHWINHAQLNREGTHIAFLYRIGHCDMAAPFLTWPLMVRVSDGELWRVPLYAGSHHDFGWDNRAILVDHNGYYEASYRASARQLDVPWPKDMQGTKDVNNGHCSYAPNTDRLILSDTYPLRTTQERVLFVWDRVRDAFLKVGAFKPKLEGPDGSARVDLHPRWNRDGRYICFDSTHEGVGRQVYVAKVAERKSALKRDFTEPPRKVFIDLGARTGDTLAQLLLIKPDASDYTVYAFECNPENKALVERNVAKMEKKVRHMELLFAAAWTEDGTISFHMDTRAKGADGQIGKTGGSLFDSPHARGNLVTVPAIDFSKWLQTKVTYEDYVECKVDIEGAEFELLERMFRDGSVLLCDVMRVEWHERFRKEYVGYPEAYTRFFKQLGIQYYSHW